MTNKTNNTGEPVFKVYKKGVTTKGPVQIVKNKNLPYDIKAKVAFYVSLGYAVTDIKESESDKN